MFIRNFKHLRLLYPAVLFILSAGILCSCNKARFQDAEDEDSFFISAVDISAYPEIAQSNPVFYDFDSQPKDLLKILKSKGINTIRLRLWVNPPDGHSGFKEVKEFSDLLRQDGFYIWIALHYSDTWADPQQQITPSAWQYLSFETLKDTVYTYTGRVVREIEPDLIQIGNEINSGILFPFGDITNHPGSFKELLRKGISAVRNISPDTRIILHYAGHENATWFFDFVRDLDYDIIGLSYYPLWHGKSLDELKNRMVELAVRYRKQILIAETAYPFTLEWNDWTHNIAGTEEQLILPDFPATPEGQQKFVRAIREIVKGLPAQRGRGFCYWGAEWIAWKGPQATDGSPWENQALFDFQNKALPALKEFRVQRNAR